MSPGYVPLPILAAGGARFVAVLKKATYRPSALMIGFSESVPKEVALAAALAQTVVPLCMSRTKISGIPLVSFAIRSLAALTNATKRPSGVIVLDREPRLAGTPFVFTVTRR